MTDAQKVNMRAAAKKRWTNPAYADVQHQHRINLKKRHGGSAFSTNPLLVPALEEFDAWEYG